MNIEICKQCKHFAISANWPKTLYPAWDDVLCSSQDIFCLISGMISKSDEDDAPSGKYLGYVKDGKAEYLPSFKMPEACPFRLEHLVSQ